MSVFTLTITSNTDASFTSSLYMELARIIRDVANQVEVNTNLGVIDFEQNSVGSWSIV